MNRLSGTESLINCRERSQNKWIILIYYYLFWCCPWHSAILGNSKWTSWKNQFKRKKKKKRKSKKKANQCAPAGKSFEKSAYLGTSDSSASFAIPTLLCLLYSHQYLCNGKSGNLVWLIIINIRLITKWDRKINTEIRIYFRDLLECILLIK